MARPGQAATQIPQPAHFLKSILGKFVMGFPTQIAPFRQEVSHGLHGISSMHSITAMGPFKKSSCLGKDGEFCSSSKEGAPTVLRYLLSIIFTPPVMLRFYLLHFYFFDQRSHISTHPIHPTPFVFFLLVHFYYKNLTLQLH